MRPALAALAFAAASLIAASPALAGDGSARDVETYDNIVSDDGGGTHLFVHAGGDLGPFAGLSINTHASFYVPWVVTASVDLGLGFGTSGRGDDEFGWGPNPWGAISVGYPFVNGAFRGGGRYDVSRQVVGNQMEINYFDAELPMYRQLVAEATVLHGTPSFDFDNRATAFGAGLRYRTHWAAQGVFRSDGRTWTPYLEHTWYLSAHVLFAQAGAEPAKAVADLPVGFAFTSSFPVVRDRDTSMNMVVGTALFPSGGAMLRLGVEWAGIVL